MDRKARTPKELEAQLNSLLDNEDGPFTRTLFDVWNAQAAALKFEEIEEAIVTRKLPVAWWQRWHDEYRTWGAQRVDNYIAWLEAGGLPELREVFALVGDELTVEMQRGFAEGIRRWYLDHTGELITALTNTQRRAVSRAIVAISSQEGISNRTLGQYLRTMVGPHRQQARGIISRARARAKEGGFLDSQGNPDILRSLDKDSDALEQYLRDVAHAKAVRGRLIARTEIASAYNAGHYESAKQIEESTALEGEVMVGRWWTQLDERVCPICSPLHNTVVELSGQFETDLIAQPVDHPPAHPRCRCLVLYEFVQADQL